MPKPKFTCARSSRLRQQGGGIERIKNFDLSGRHLVASRAEIERIVRLLATGARLRLVVLGPDANPESFDEAMARLTFEHNTTGRPRIVVFKWQRDQNESGRSRAPVSFARAQRRQRVQP